MGATMLTLAMLCVCALPQLPTARTPASAEQRFVDFSADLARPGVHVVIGELTRLRDGKRERMRDGALGNASSSVSISGIVFYKVAVTGRVDVAETLAGKDIDGRLDLAFDVQWAKLPDGSERRQSLTGNGARIEKDMRALWVVEDPPKGSTRKLLHVIAADPDGGDDAEASFATDMKDFVAINRRIAELVAALDGVEPKDGLAVPESAIAELRKVADAELECLDPANQGLVSTRVEPLVQRAKKKLEKLADR